MIPLSRHTFTPSSMQHHDSQQQPACALIEGYSYRRSPCPAPSSKGHPWLRLCYWRPSHPPRRTVTEDSACIPPSSEQHFSSQPSVTLKTFIVEGKEIAQGHWYRAAARFALSWVPLQYSMEQWAGPTTNGHIRPKTNTGSQLAYRGNPPTYGLSGYYNGN